MKIRILLFPAAVLCVATLACHSGNRGIDYGDEPVQNTVDTVRGVVSTVGTEPVVEVVIATTPGPRLVVTGGQTARLRSLGKVEVMLSGRYPGLRSMTAAPGGLRAFEADRFIVRAADGIPAYDGVIHQEGARYFLISASGRRWAADFLPESLRALVGSRVFLAGPLSAPPAAYGVISEPGR